MKVHVNIEDVQSEAESDPARKRWTKVRVAPGPELMQVEANAYVKLASGRRFRGANCRPGLRHRLLMIGWNLCWLKSAAAQPLSLGTSWHGARNNTFGPVLGHATLPLFGRLVL